MRACIVINYPPRQNTRRPRHNLPGAAPPHCAGRGAASHKKIQTRTSEHPPARRAAEKQDLSMDTTLRYCTDELSETILVTLSIPPGGQWSPCSGVGLWVVMRPVLIIPLLHSRSTILTLLHNCTLFTSSQHCTDWDSGLIPIKQIRVFIDDSVHLMRRLGPALRTRTMIYGVVSSVLIAPASWSDQ